MKREYQKVRDINGDGYRIVGYEHEEGVKIWKNINAKLYFFELIDQQLTLN